MTRVGCIILAAICLAQAAVAENVIQLWGPGADPNNPSHYVLGTHYSVDPDTRAVLIHQGSDPNIPWMFYAYNDAYDPDDPNSPGGIIDDIRIVPIGPVGTIRLSIMADPNHIVAGQNWGAQHVKRIDLVTNADPNSENTIERLALWGDLGANGPVWAHRLDGTCTVEGGLLNELRVGYLNGEFSCGGAGADIYVTAATGTDPGAHITIGGGPYAGTIDVTGALAEVQRDGRLSGMMSLAGH